MIRYQDEVGEFMRECFGAASAADRPTRNWRFLEESAELVQALGCTREEAHQVVDYVFGRLIGDPPQEVGGVMVTLAALCNAWSLNLGGGRKSIDLDMEACGDVELKRCWTRIEQIREKQKQKPKFGPLPGPSDATLLSGHTLCEGSLIDVAPVTPGRAYMVPVCTVCRKPVDLHPVAPRYDLVPRPSAPTLPPLTANDLAYDPCLGAFWKTQPVVEPLADYQIAVCSACGRKAQDHLQIPARQPCAGAFWEAPTPAGFQGDLKSAVCSSCRRGIEVHE